MAVKIRLMRTGMHKTPSYRVVIADARSPRDGRIVENIGWYNPLTQPATLNIDETKALKWLGNGAQPTDSMLQLLKTAGIYQKYQDSKPAKAPKAKKPAKAAKEAKPAAKTTKTAAKSEEKTEAAPKRTRAKKTEEPATAE